MSVPTDTVTATYTFNVYTEGSPHIEFTVTVTGNTDTGDTVTPDDMDGYLRTGVQAMVDAFHTDYPTAPMYAGVVYDRRTAGTPVTPS